MKKEDLLYVGGVVRPLDKILRANASYEAGFLGSNFYSAGTLGVKGQQTLDHELALIAEYEKNLRPTPVPLREAARECAKTIGLSKGAKVRHDKKRLKLARIDERLRTLKRPTGSKTELDSRNGHDSFEGLYVTTERSNACVLPLKHEKTTFKPNSSPVSLHLQKRDWSGQYRAQVITQPPAGSAPDANLGERFTEKLTKRSVSKIFESGAYVAQCHEGFTTFLTLTFSSEQRMALFGAMSEAEGRPYTPLEFVRDTGTLVHGKDGQYTLLPKQPFKIIKTMETTMGREVSRFLDGCKKMYQRGWETEEGEKVNAHYKARPSEFGPDRDKADFHYIWVAECPPSKDENGDIIGEPNPHIHLVMRWSVDKSVFREWAKRLESLWGQGMAHLEWIKQPKAASSYLIKALGYAAKGENADQGLIRGNRYNIARCSRAPSWETLATFEADNITAVIKELGYKLEQWKKPLKRSLSRINKMKAQTIKASGIAKVQNKPQSHLDKLQVRIIRLERAAKKVTQDMKQKEMHVSSLNRFSITFDGEKSRDRLDSFLYWACGARGWSMELIGATGQYSEVLGREVYGVQHGIDMRDMRERAREQYQSQYDHFRDRRAYWQCVLRDVVPDEPNEDEINHWQSVKADYLEGKLAA